MRYFNNIGIDIDKRLVVHPSDINYRIRPNNHNVRLGFSKLLGTLSCGKICIYLLSIRYKKRDQKRTYLMMIMRSFFLIFFVKAYIVIASISRCNSNKCKCVNNICLDIL